MGSLNVAGMGTISSSDMAREWTSGSTFALNNKVWCIQNILHIHTNNLFERMFGLLKSLIRYIHIAVNFG